ncbi:MAG: hypothetical protein SR1Q5_01510 [Quinella sp. 1Q5]|nr:hypothetical protein [Quinella sp. 1Q5]
MKNFLAMVCLLLILSAPASAMNLTLHEPIGIITLGREPFTLNIEGYTKLDGDFSKGVAVFGDNLYFHFDCRKVMEENFDAASRFGGSDSSNAVPVYVFEGRTQIYPISGDDGRNFYLLATETGGGSSLKVIGDRDGSWVKYFDTLNMRNQIPYEFYLDGFRADGDTIIFLYKEWQKENYCQLCYKWDEAAQWFGVEVQ